VFNLTKLFAIGALAGLLSWSFTASAQEKVQFPSLNDNGTGQAPTMLDGYLFRVKGDKPRPAVVFMHGCWGMFDGNHRIEAVERQWAQRLNAAGYDVLSVDGNTPRNIKETCSEKTFSLTLFVKRSNDAYGALVYLQSQTFIHPDAIGLMGWASGGGATLLTVGKDNPGRAASLPHGDFRAAVALYPAICDDKFHVVPWTAYVTPAWTTNIPLLILDGGQDVWTPATICQKFVDGAKSRGAKVEMRIYPDAYHAFDVPDLKRVEFPAYSQPYNVTPILATDPKARADALRTVPKFFAQYLGK
jgi:dienelactone hydrolase